MSYIPINLDRTCFRFFSPFKWNGLQTAPKLECFIPLGGLKTLWFHVFMTPVIFFISWVLVLLFLFADWVFVCEYFLILMSVLKRELILNKTIWLNKYEKKSETWALAQTVLVITVVSNCSIFLIAGDIFAVLRWIYSCTLRVRV